MRWQDGRQSDNVDDRGSSGGGRMMVGGGLGLGGVVIVVLLMLAGVDPRVLLQNLPDPNDPIVQVGVGDGADGERQPDPQREQAVAFTRVILGSTEDIWGAEFRQLGRQYEQPKLILFSNETKSACGFASSAVGPFYCPADEQVYLDLAFFEELRRRFHAPGESAQAYVIAHEIGHHVQKQLGISDKFERLREGASKAEQNHLSVRLELQADFLAGIWAHEAAKANLFESGDIDAALNAASQIGDDRLQMQAQGYVVPDAFTHGSSAERMKAFRQGYDTGDLRLLNQYFESAEP